VSRQAVSAWVAGQKLPGLERRLALEREYAIPAASWDVKAVATAPATPNVASNPPPAAPGQARELTAYERALAHASDVDAQIAEAQGSGASYTEMARLFSVRSGALTALARCQPTWVTLLESPEWRDILARLHRALEPHPAAARAVAVELDGFDGA